MKLYIPRKTVFRIEFVGTHTTQLNPSWYENVFPSGIYCMGPVEVLHNVGAVVVLDRAPVLYEQVGHEREPGCCRISRQ